MSDPKPPMTLEQLWNLLNTLRSYDQLRVDDIDKRLRVLEAKEQK